MAKGVLHYQATDYQLLNEVFRFKTLRNPKGHFGFRKHHGKKPWISRYLRKDCGNSRLSHDGKKCEASQNMNFKRSPELIRSIISEGRSIIAVHKNRGWAEFCYLNEYENGKFVSCSGLIVSPSFRDHGIAGEVKVLV